MADFQTFVGIITTLLVFLTGVFLNYDTLQFTHYQLVIPQWVGILFAGITFSFVAMDQLLRGFVRLEEKQRRTEDVQRQAEEEQRRVREEKRQTEEREAERVRRTEEEQRRLGREEQEARRTRIETRYRTAIIRWSLTPNDFHRKQLADILALLEEYQDTL